MAAQTLTARYPCCGKPCRLRFSDHEVVQRDHYCDPDDETGTAWQIETELLRRVGDSMVHRVTFLDLGSDEAERQYGTKRIPHRRRTSRDHHV